MREIKIRVWDGKYMDYNPECIFSDNVDINEQLSSFNDLMQDTGLKDKNGKEIYEGDVCRVDYTDGWELGVVEYEKGTYYLIYKSLGMNHDKIEVVGNIYENPELLEEDEKNDKR